MHNTAMSQPRHGFEEALVNLIRGVHQYADAHKQAYKSSIGEDGVLGDAWRDVAKGILTLLNGDAGRLDCGTIDREIRRLASDNGFNGDDM